MKKTIYLIVLLFIASTLLADWDPGDGHKMHWPQLPDPNGWDVSLYDEPFMLADDWQCSETGYVCWIHFWISYWEDMIDDIAYIHLSIHDNIPMGPNDYSIPGNLLWSYDLLPGEFTIRDPELGDQGWFNPFFGQFWEHNHVNYFQVNSDTICDFTDAFFQIEGEIYWLDIAIHHESFLNGFIGWKTSISPHFMDDAVYWNDVPEPGWYELRDPITNESLDLAFVIDGIDDPNCPVELSSFNTSFINGSAILNWTTQSEDNNLGWNVYRSLSENLGQANQVNYDIISGAGTTTEPTHYVFNDINELENNTTYWYWLESTSYSGETDVLGPVTLTIQYEDNQITLPTESFLCENYPNPFNPVTNIEFSVKEGESGSLTIYNVKGQMLETHQYEAGEHQLKWDATQYGSGIYFYKLDTQSYIETKKMIMLK